MSREQPANTKQAALVTVFQWDGKYFEFFIKLRVLTFREIKEFNARFKPGWHVGFGLKKCVRN